MSTLSNFTYDATTTGAGEVRVGFEVIMSTLPMVRKPPRGSPSGSVTLRNSGPVTPSIL